MKEKPSTIWIRPSTKKRLEKLREKGETYEEIILKLLKKDNPLLDLDLKGRKLYRQGVEARPFFVQNPYFAAFSWWGRKSSIAWFYGKKNYSYWDEDITNQKGREIIEEHIKEGNKLQIIIKEWERIVQEQKELESEIINLQEKENNEIIDLLMKLSSILDRAWKIGIIIEAFDPNSEGIIESILNKYDQSNISIKEFKQLCSPEKLTKIQEELFGLYQIALERDYEKLDEHAEKFFWISNSWADAKDLTKDYFKAKITRLKEEQVNFRGELKKISQQQETLKKQKTSILKSKLPLVKEIQRALEFFELMTIWRERRKKWAMISVNYLTNLAKEVSRRTNLPKELLLFALHSEINIPLDRKLVEELKERSKFCLQFYQGDEKKILAGEKAKQFVEEIKSEQQSSGDRLYGNVANPGKIEGIAKIIFTTDDLQKMNKGDILVSPCTRPEYVSAMKKASAILTDEGGITSHAAIISRELSIPCIVGLRQATDLIKDGDKIVVNANHGIVTIKK